MDIDVRVADGWAVLEIRDDGVGGADPGGAPGLRGLRDRVGALDGELEIDSEVGAGTTVRPVWSGMSAAVQPMARALLRLNVHSFTKLSRKENAARSSD